MPSILRSLALAALATVTNAQLRFYPNSTFPDGIICPFRDGVYCRSAAGDTPLFVTCKDGIATEDNCINKSGPHTTICRQSSLSAGDAHCGPPDAIISIPPYSNHTANATITSSASSSTKTWVSKPWGSKSWAHNSSTTTTLCSTTPSSTPIMNATVTSSMSSSASTWTSKLWASNSTSTETPCTTTTSTPISSETPCPSSSNSTSIQSSYHPTSWGTGYAHPTTYIRPSWGTGVPKPSQSSSSSSITLSITYTPKPTPTPSPSFSQTNPPSSAGATTSFKLSSVILAAGAGIAATLM
ncbi:hypothetical protein BT63DRAFT_420041, partial [Microthyrium microscopicum]